MRFTRQFASRIINNSKLFVVLLLGIHRVSYAEDMNLGDVAMNLTDTFNSLGALMLFGINLVGLAFGVTGIMKLKQHKDNPSAVQLGQPILLIILSGVLLFFPVLIKVVEGALFTPING